MLAHSVYYSLNDNSPEFVQALVESCNRHLSGFPGIVHYTCGALNRKLRRQVNDLYFDVAVHIVFDSFESHEAYADSEAHHQFIRDNRRNWQMVRVFDSDVLGSEVEASHRIQVATAC